MDCPEKNNMVNKLIFNMFEYIMLKLLSLRNSYMNLTIKLEENKYFLRNSHNA